MTKKNQKIKATSVMVMCVIVGFFIGVAFGALMDALLPVMLVTTLAGAVLGWYLDRRNGITYGRRH